MAENELFGCQGITKPFGFVISTLPYVTLEYTSVELKSLFGGMVWEVIMNINSEESHSPHICHVYCIAVTMSE